MGEGEGEVGEEEVPMQFVKPSQHSAHFLLCKVEGEWEELGKVVQMLHFPEKIVKPKKKFWVEEGEEEVVRMVMVIVIVIVKG